MAAKLTLYLECFFSLLKSYFLIDWVDLNTVNSEIFAKLIAIFNVANMYFNAIRENKVLAKVLEFTVGE